MATMLDAFNPWYQGEDNTVDNGSVAKYGHYVSDKQMENERKEQARIDKNRATSQGLKGQSNEARIEEEKTKDKLNQATSKTASAVDTLLASLIDQTGYTAGLSKQAIGSQQAERGMLRSGQTAQRYEGVDVAQGAAVTDYTKQRNAQVRKIYDTRNNAFQGMSDKRKQIQMQLNNIEAQGMASLDYQQQALEMKMNMDQFITDMKMSSQATKDTMAMLNSLGTLAGVGAGYYAGGSAEPGTNNDYGITTTEGNLDTGGSSWIPSSSNQ